MASTIVARNYAEILYTLATRHGGDTTVDQYGDAINDVAALLEREPRVREFLETPRVDVDAKKRVIESAFGGRVPDLFLRFLLIVVEKRRQAALRKIAEQYHDIVDEARNRVRAEIRLAREADVDLREDIVSSIEGRLGKTVLPSFEVDPSLIGGVVIRAGGQILDGSVRRRAAGLRQRLLKARLPAATTAETSY
ncbi:MAG: ATP synthase F1 subunit delta [Gemmatimonadota bacterium]